MHWTRCSICPIIKSMMCEMKILRAPNSTSSSLSPREQRARDFDFFFQCLKSYARKMFFCIFKLFWIILLKNLKQQEEDKFTCSAMKKCENLPHYCCLNFLHICHTHVSGNQANFNIKQGWPEKRQYIVFKWWLHLLGHHLEHVDVENFSMWKSNSS